MLITSGGEEKGNVAMEVARQIKGKVEEHTNLGSVRLFPLAAKLPRGPVRPRKNQQNKCAWY